ncbi:cold-shock' DNA-binding domain-containing protein [Polychytrium aggregatum]|uniref:cold-shock' DNA-binding domain-containing protein n=1 Tax=Polychytrium aggregatum TaxID=110093 RepID=UPI0022FEE5B4|nr:cold-shock' DNA-binding domain-containing protein [Polychytrium aggregatum]KAI9208837.1 cold-shock' DNA-binding domain-containing protein [Polychytrium aggregatum]
MEIDERRYTGTVKFFNSQKGYGFIVPVPPIPDDPEGEVFVHHTAIMSSSRFRSLAEGEVVEFHLLRGPKGMQAAKVTGPGFTNVKGDPKVSTRRRSRSGQQSRNSPTIPPPPYDSYYYPGPGGYYIPSYYYPTVPQIPPNLSPAGFSAAPPKGSPNTSAPSMMPKTFLHMDPGQPHSGPSSETSSPPMSQGGPQYIPYNYGVIAPPQSYFSPYPPGNIR